MGRKIDVDDLVDAQTVARLLGLSHRTTVAGYLRRYEDFPRPVVDFRSSKIRLWLRQEIETWNRGRH